MTKTIDISGKLTNDRPVLKLAEGKEYPVDNRKNTVFEMQKHMEEYEGSDLDRVWIALSMLLGEAAAKEIDDMDLSFDGYQTVFIAASAAALGEEFEVVEARFLAARKTV